MNFELIIIQRVNITAPLPHFFCLVELDDESYSLFFSREMTSTIIEFYFDNEHQYPSIHTDVLYLAIQSWFAKKHL